MAVLLCSFVWKWELLLTVCGEAEPMTSTDRTLLSWAMYSINLCMSVARHTKWLGHWSDRSRDLGEERQRQSQKIPYVESWRSENCFKHFGDESSVWRLVGIMLALIKIKRGLEKIHQHMSQSTMSFSHWREKRGYFTEKLQSSLAVELATNVFQNANSNNTVFQYRTATEETTAI